MIFVNGRKVVLDKFGDGTLKCNASVIVDETGMVIEDLPHASVHYSQFNIVWAYDEDSELFALRCIVDYIRSVRPMAVIILELPYIPNARQDRFVSNRLFTLKTFCSMINEMRFHQVIVTDPHSSVSEALLDRVVVTYFVALDQGSDAIMFPDAGAAKKYTENISLPSDTPVIIGNKHRDKDGRVSSYELMNFPEGIKSVTIKDDIISYGGTFVEAAKALRAKGVEKIYLEVTHCESNIFKGQVFDYVDKVITTDSILDLDNHDFEGVTEEKLKKLEIEKMFRRGVCNVY